MGSKAGRALGKISVKFSERYNRVEGLARGRRLEVGEVGDEFPGLSDKSDRIFIDAKLAISSRVTIPELCISPLSSPYLAAVRVAGDSRFKVYPTPARASFAVELRPPPLALFGYVTCCPSCSLLLRYEKRKENSNFFDRKKGNEKFMCGRTESRVAKVKKIRKEGNRVSRVRRVYPRNGPRRVMPLDDKKHITV